MQPREPSLDDYEELRHYVPHGHGAPHAGTPDERGSMLRRLIRAIMRRFLSRPAR